MDEAERKLVAASENPWLTTGERLKVLKAGTSRSALQELKNRQKHTTPGVGVYRASRGRGNWQTF
jgi:hypothetical protein